MHGQRAATEGGDQPSNPAASKPASSSRIAAPSCFSSRFFLWPPRHVTDARSHRARLGAGESSRSQQTRRTEPTRPLSSRPYRTNHGQAGTRLCIYSRCVCVDCASGGRARRQRARRAPTSHVCAALATPPTHAIPNAQHPSHKIHPQSHPIPPHLFQLTGKPKAPLLRAEVGLIGAGHLPYGFFDGGRTRA